MKTSRIYDTLLNIFDREMKQNVPTCRAVDLLIEERLRSNGVIHSSYLPQHAGE